MKKKTALSREDQALLCQLVAGTHKIKQDAIVHQPQCKKISGVPIKRLIQEQADASHYFSDEFRPLLNTEGPVKYVHPGVSHFEAKKLRRDGYSLELFLDLHDLTQLQAEQELGASIVVCRREHVFYAYVTHGHGKHILKQQTPLWLVQHPHVMVFHQAPKEYGGDATLLVLIEVDEWLSPELPWMLKGGQICPFSLEHWRLAPGNNERNNRALIEKRKQFSDNFCGLVALTPQRDLRMTICCKRLSTNYSPPSTAIWHLSLLWRRIF